MLKKNSGSNLDGCRAAAHEIENETLSMAKSKKAAAKAPAKRTRDPLGPTKHELRCAAKSQTKNCYLGGSKALYEASAEQRRRSGVAHFGSRRACHGVCFLRLYVASI